MSINKIKNYSKYTASTSVTENDIKNEGHRFLPKKCGDLQMDYDKFTDDDHWTDLQLLEFLSI